MAFVKPASLLRSSLCSPRRPTSSVIRRTQIGSPAAASPAILRRYATEGFSGVEPPDYLDERERKIFDMIQQGLRPEKLEVSRHVIPDIELSRLTLWQVQDISGGCGSMYALDIVSDQFKGLPVIKQHRLVNKVLGEEIKKWHGVQLKTKAP